MPSARVRHAVYARSLPLPASTLRTFGPPALLALCSTPRLLTAEAVCARRSGHVYFGMNCQSGELMAVKQIQYGGALSAAAVLNAQVALACAWRLEVACERRSGGCCMRETADDAGVDVAGACKPIPYPTSARCFVAAA